MDQDEALFDLEGSDLFDAFAPDEQEDGPFETDLQDRVMGMLLNGRMTREVNFAGHTFLLRTLLIGEELAVAEVIREYQDTVASAKAIATATIAAAVEMVDGQLLAQPLGPDIVSSIRQKFLYIRNNWFWLIISRLYEEYVLLLEDQMIAFRAFEGK